MINLQKTSGISILYDETNKRLISPALLMKSPNVRTIEQMRNVLIKKEALNPKELYYMYRGVCFEKDLLTFQKNKISYDITVIPSAIVGNEFVKTLGHYHQHYNIQLSYPEVYEVLSGEAVYLMQREDLKDIIVCRAKEGDKVVIPPNYGHITINASRKDLVMANLVSTAFKSNYEPIVQREGAAYYLINEQGVEKFVKNIRYHGTPRPREIDPDYLKPKNLDLTRDPIYVEFIKNPKIYEFLSKPDIIYYETQRT